MISNYAMFPLLVLATLALVPLNIYLIWEWVSRGQYDTIVNKLICIQRAFWTFYYLGVVVDFYLRLQGFRPAFLTESNYCSFWLVYYNIFLYLLQTTNLTIALVRFTCVKYPIAYHTRSVIVYCQTQPKLKLQPGRFSFFLQLWDKCPQILQIGGHRSFR